MLTSFFIYIYVSIQASFMSTIVYKKNEPIRLISSIFFAESGGFEPSIRLRVYRISSAALSTTQTTFRLFAAKVLLFS